MINPNRLYNAKGLWVIVNILNPLSNIGKVLVQNKDGQQLEDWLSDLGPRSNRYKIGDVVKISCQFSIMSDCFKIKHMRVIKQKTLDAWTGYTQPTKLRKVA